MKSIKRKKINTIIIVSAGAVFLLWIVLRIAFPSFYYFLDKTDRFKISIIKYQIDKKYYLTLTPLFDYPYNLLRFKFQSNQKFDNDLEDTTIFKDYISQLYPMGSPITNQKELKEFMFFENKTNLSNGSLISYGEAVYFISHGKARPFLGPEIFERLGFDWKDVLPVSGDQFANFKKDEKLNFVSPHPDGTILETKEGKLFLIWKKERRPIINKNILKTVWPDYYSIKVDKNNAKKVGSCEKGISFSKTIRCHAKPNNNFISQGGTYSIEVSQSVFEKTSKAKITVSMIGNFDLTTAKESLKRIKDQLYLRYNGHTK